MERRKDKLRNIRGGLDNAVEQADSRHFSDLFIVDIDCHIFEPFSSFSTYMPSKWRREFDEAKVLEESDKFRLDYRAFTGSSSEAIDPVKLKLLKAFNET